MIPMQVWGDKETWLLVFQDRDDQDVSETHAMEVPGGVVLRETLSERRGCAVSLVFVPGARVHSEWKDGKVVSRRLVNNRPT